MARKTDDAVTAETWPRWLPAPNLRDNELHWAPRRGENGACGQETMWVEPGHPTTKRRRCARCVLIAGQDLEPRRRAGRA